MTDSAESHLRRLRRVQGTFGPGSAGPKLDALRALEASRLPRARQVLELHEALLFLRSYPDDAAVLEQAETMLRRFDQRPDLRRHRAALADSGIAGTEINYAFFQATASRLVHRFGPLVDVDWEGFEHEDTLLQRLNLLAVHGETPGLDEADLTAREWVGRMKAPGESDGSFLVRGFDRLPVPDAVREQLFDELELPLRLRPGPGTPSRTTGRWDGRPVAWQTRPLRRERPDLSLAIRRRPRSIRPASVREGRELVALARDAMVTRSRDLDAFAYADPRDVRLVDCGEGLQFAVLGVIPQRRLLLEAVYAFLTIKNGVPIGYVLVSALFNSSEIAYNVFDTWRGAEAAWIYGRVLATTRALFGSDTFTVYPYQLGGDGNDEGLRSGAWWFYQKLGFRARSATVLRLMRAELTRLRRNPAHRSSRATLAKLAAENVYLDLGPVRDDVIGLFPLGDVGLAVTGYLARRFGADREAGEERCAVEVAGILGVRGWRQWPPAERQAFRRWSPLVRALAGVETWRPAHRAALVRVLRAKGGRRESDFVRLIDAHEPLRSALRDLVRRPPRRTPAPE